MAMPCSAASSLWPARMKRLSDTPRWLRSVLVLLLLLGLCFGGIRYCQNVGRTFDAQAWRDAAGGTRIRGRMAPDLVASRRLVGMTRAEVVALLGPPQRVEAGTGGGRLLYNLGLPVDGYGIDDDVLDVSIGPDGRVAEVRVYSS